MFDCSDSDQSSSVDDIPTKIYRTCSLLLTEIGHTLTRIEQLYSVFMIFNDEVGC